MKKIIYIFIIALFFTQGACTDDFVELNENPYQVSDESLKQDFNKVGAFWSPDRAQFIP